MAGATQLEGPSRAIEQSIRVGDLDSARAAAGVLDVNAADFARHASKLL
jgi:hypothetical protein